MYSSAGSGAAAPAAAAPSPGGGCRVGTALVDLAGVDVGDTLFVGDPWKKIISLFNLVYWTKMTKNNEKSSKNMSISPLLETWKCKRRSDGQTCVENKLLCLTQTNTDGSFISGDQTDIKYKWQHMWSHEELISKLIKWIKNARSKYKQTKKNSEVWIKSLLGEKTLHVVIHIS